MTLHKAPSLAAFGTVFLLASCGKPTPPATSHAHYVIGAGWHGRDAWFYPNESFTLRQTGLAVREDPSSRMNGYKTADGESWYAASMTGAHQTLQLPAIVSVRNLENGRIVRIRLNDRGPASEGRILAVTPQVARLLGMSDDRPVPIELAVDEAASRAIAESAPDAPKLDIVAAPRGDVTAESLDRPDDKRAIGSRNAQPVEASQAIALPRLPATYQQGAARPVRYAVTLASFANHAPANQVAARCGGQVTAAPENSEGLRWQVRLGPFAGVSQADTALARAHGCGIADARIVVE